MTLVVVSAAWAFVVFALWAWASRAYTPPRTEAWERSDDLRLIDEARAEFEDAMVVVGAVPAGRRTLPMPWLSLDCSSGRHHLCRPDVEACTCPCGHNGVTVPAEAAS